jgi:hypothetical protein
MVIAAVVAAVAKNCGGAALAVTLALALALAPSLTSIWVCARA